MERALLIDLRGGRCWTELLDGAAQNLPRPGPFQALQRVTVDTVEQHALAFPEEAFDRVSCPLGLSLLPGIQRALAEWRRVIKPGGSVNSSAFRATAFRPLMELYAEQLFEFGLAPVADAAIHPWRRFADAEAVSRLVRDSGFCDVNVVVEQLGSRLPDANAWWDVVAGSSLFLPLEGLSSDELETFKIDHLREVTMLATPGGIWLDVSTAFVTALKQETW